MRLWRVVLVAGLIGAPQAWPFEPIQPETFAAGGALVNAWADVDGDGDLDLYVGFGAAAARLYRNDAGRFTDVAASAGLAIARGVRGAAFGDADGDGDPDLAVGHAPGGGSTLALWRNGSGTFTDVTGQAGLATLGGAVRQLAWIDVDSDADLDLFVAFRDRPNALFRQQDGRFVDVAGELGLADARRSVGAVWFDADEDGDLDLYVANMDGDPNGLFRNDDGRFVDVAEAAGLAWGGRAPKDPANGTVRPCAADVDGDGRFDLVTANYGPNGIFLNRGGGRFADASASWGVALDSRDDTCALADVDHDGRLDLYVNGTVTGGVSYRDYLFRNTGTRFEDVTPESLRVEASHGVQWADADGDGDLDLALAGTRPDATHRIFRNGLPADAARRSLQIRVLDDRKRARFAGAEVCVSPAGAARPMWCRLVDSGSGYNSQNDMPVHIGLPAADRVDVVVRPKQRGVADVRLAGVDPSRRVLTVTVAGR